MNVVIVGDVDASKEARHVGVDANLHCVIDQLRARDFNSFTVVTGNAVLSRNETNTTVIQPIGFNRATAGNRADRESRLATVVQAATGRPDLLDWQDPAWGVIEAVAASDAVVIAGSDKLSSVWPEHIYELCAVAAIAEVFKKPIVIASQTIGPSLLERDSDLITEMLSRATLIGLREVSSYSLAEALGVDVSRLRLAGDDSMFLEGEAHEVDISESYCVVSLSSDIGLASPPLFISQLAAFLDEVSDRTGLQLVLVPHFEPSTNSDLPSDSELHAQVAELMITSNFVALPILSAWQVAEVTRNAALCVATRHSALVFAASGGVPSIGISVDHCSAVKVGGAQTNMGTAEWAIPLLSLPSGSAGAVLAETWDRRSEMGEHLLSVASKALANSFIWWDEVAEALRGTVGPAPDLPAIGPIELWNREIASVNARMIEWSSSESASSLAARLLWLAEKESVDQLRLEITQAELAVGQIQADLESAEQRVMEADSATSAAHALVSVIAEPIFTRTLSAHEALGAAAELDALLKTRTFRWTRKARSVYGTIRRRTAKPNT